VIEVVDETRMTADELSDVVPHEDDWKVYIQPGGQQKGGETRYKNKTLTMANSPLQRGGTSQPFPDTGWRKFTRHPWQSGAHEIAHTLGHGSEPDGEYEVFEGGGTIVVDEHNLTSAESKLSHFQRIALGRWGHLMDAGNYSRPVRLNNFEVCRIAKSQGTCDEKRCCLGQGVRRPPPPAGGITEPPVYGGTTERPGGGTTPSKSRAPSNWKTHPQKEQWFEKDE
jgi:hypothetical protein